MLMYTTTFLGYDFFFIFCYIDFVKSLNRINQQFNQVSINFVIWIEGSIICQIMISLWIFASQVLFIVYNALWKYVYDIHVI